jgi:hypothetical protein
VNVSFQFPQMYSSCTVEVSNDPSRSDNMMGIVTKVKGQAVDVMVVTDEGISLRRDVWHADDPRCIEHPQHFEQNLSGVFRLSESEKQRRQLMGRLDALEARLAGLSAELRQIAARPKRGRPPGKQRDSEPALV